MLLHLFCKGKSVQKDTYDIHRGRSNCAEIKHRLLFPEEKNNTKRFRSPKLGFWLFDPLQKIVYLDCFLIKTLFCVPRANGTITCLYVTILRHPQLL